MAFRVFRRLRDMLDVNASSPSDTQVLTYDSASSKWIASSSAGGGGGAPTTATYITQTANASLSAEQALASLATGIVKNTTTTGVLSIAAQGTDYYAPSGTDVAVADGGTGSSTAADARTALGLAIGTDVQAQDATLSALAAADWVANSVPVGTGANTLSQTAMGASTILARLAAGNIVAATPAELRTLLALVIGTNVEAWDQDLDAIAALAPSNDDLIQRKAGVWTNRTIAQLLTDLGLGALYQPLEATLTALAAANWAANALPIGTGADALSQTAFAASTFPARASTGNLVAKTISDFALTLLDDADAATFRATLGGFMTITEYASGTETVSTTEWSLTTDTSGPDVQTDDGEYQFFLDVSTLTKADVYQFAIYEKVLSAGTQRKVFTATLANTQSEPIWVSPKLILLHGWDATLLKVSGADASITFSVRRIAAS